MASVNGELPLEPKIPLGPIMGGVRDQRNEQRTGFDLLADRGIPGVPAAQLALVEPHLDSCGSQCLADFQCG